MSSAVTEGTSAQGRLDQETRQKIQEQQLARALLNNLFVSLRTAYIHKRESDIVKRRVADIAETAQDLLAMLATDGFELRRVGNGFFLNRDPIRLDSGLFQHAEFLRSVCDDLEIGTIEIRRGSDEKAFGDFVAAAVDAVRNPEGSSLKRDLGTIALHPPPESQGDSETRDRQQSLLETYAGALSLTSRTVALWNHGKRPRMSEIKRVAQSLLDIVDEDGVTVLGLTQLRTYRGRLETHLVNVAILALLIGRRAGLDRDRLVNLGVTGLLHELGCVDLPRELLERIDTLGESEAAEFARLPLHSIKRMMELDTRAPDSAERAIAVFENRAHVPVAFRYKAKVSADPIAMILSVADAYDHLTSSRLGNAAMRPDRALERLLLNADKKYAEWAVKLLVGSIGRFPVGTLVELDSGERGVVFDRAAADASVLRPRVRLLAGRDGIATAAGEVVDLSELGPDKRPKRSIVRTLDPDEHQINVPHFFLR